MCVCFDVWVVIKKRFVLTFSRLSFILKMRLRKLMRIRHYWFLCFVKIRSRGSNFCFGIVKGFLCWE